MATGNLEEYGTPFICTPQPDDLGLASQKWHTFCATDDQFTSALGKEFVTDK